MAYLTDDQLKDGSSEQKTVALGKTANVVLTEYAPFQYGPAKDKTMPKHLGKDADTGEEYEFVGFAFHDAVKGLNDAITPGITVVRVSCLDNGTKYPDYELSVVTGVAGAAPSAASGQAF
jgi:hypothetical protein